MYNQKEYWKKWRSENPEKVKAYSKKSYELNKYKIRERSKIRYIKNRVRIKLITQRNDRIRRLKRYGLTSKEYEQILEKQNGKCLICGIHQSDVNQRFHVDHDHLCCSGITSCGKCIRGLLCKWCNGGLGGFKDSIESLTRAIEYLKRYNETKT